MGEDERHEACWIDVLIFRMEKGFFRMGLDGKKKERRRTERGENDKKAGKDLPPNLL